jgi:hypothetical protein
MNLIFFEKNKMKVLDERICLRDLIKETKNDHQSKEIIDFAKGKTYDYDGHGYIKFDMAVKIMCQFKTKQSDKLLKDLERQKDFSLVIPKDSLNINYDTSFIVDISDTIDKYQGYNVVYMIVLGIFKGGLLIKYGHTKDLIKRLKDHRRTYKPQTSTDGNDSSIKLVYAAITDNNKIVEDTFKQFIRSKNLNVGLEFDGEMRIELFTTDKDFTFDKAKNEMSRIVQEKKSKVNLELEDHIQSLADKYEALLANKDNEIQQLKNNNDNEKEIKLRQIDADKEIKLKQIEMEGKNKIENKEKDSDSEDDENDDNDENIYLQFLNESTKENGNGHIHCTILYEGFKLWFMLKYPDKKVPGNKIFVKNLRKHKTVCKVYANDKSQIGIKNLKLINIHPKEDVYS